MSTDKFLFITGLSGAGKTTLGEALKNNSTGEFVHFNVDVWAFGGDAIVESSAVPTPAMMEKRDPHLKTLFDTMISEGFQKLSAGEVIADNTVWTNFFDALFPALENAFAETKTAGKTLIVSFSVYLQHVRDYIRAHFAALEAPVAVHFVVLSPRVEDVAQRKVQHLKNTAEARNLTLSQFLRSFNPNSDAPELSEEEISAIFVGQTMASAKGFESKGENEEKTLLIDGNVTADEAKDRVLQYFATL